MAFDPVTAILNTANTVLDRVLPDKSANDAAKAQLLSMQMKGEIDAQLAQIEVDKVEAASQSVWVSGWRPGAGWCCVFALAYGFVLQPFIQTALVVFHSSFDPTKLPALNGEELFALLSGLLGLGTLRTIDKSKGTGNGH